MFSIAFELDRSIIIDKPVNEVYQHVGNFNHWRTWSPWIIQEPECPVTIGGEPVQLGHQQEWDGERIGSGRMELIEQTENAYLAYDLVFLKPWKSESKTQFKFEPIVDGDGNEQTKVTWYMQGTLPIFLFFMKKSMDAFVGGDYERGLKMLKELIEDDQVSSSVKIKGISKQSGFYYVGIERSCDTDEISKIMGPVFQDLTARDLPAPDTVLTINVHFDPVKKKCALIAALGYQSRPDVKLPIDMVAGEVPDHEALEVLHTGRYQHLANGWATLMNYMRFAKIKSSKKVKEYEVYLNSPEDTAETELKTAIFAPVK